MSVARRRLVFAIVLAGCAALAVVAIVTAIGSSGSASELTSSSARGALEAARARGRPAVVFLRLGGRHGKASGQVAVSDAGPSTAGRSTAQPLDCDRAYYAGGRGLCLAPGSGFAAGYRVREFDSRMRVLHEITVPGIPSRARVSADGRYGAVTFFVAGHAYADPGTFSTQTTLIDMRTGRKIADLEQFSVSRHGRVVTAVDVNYWGITFARDSDTFYATLATGGKTYLIKGSISGRSGRVLKENVECPSLSPDGARIAYKKRVGRAGDWRLTVLDLATMRETPLAETRSVDDQAEWLDDRTVLYGADGAVWAARADGGGRPRRYIAGAASPAVVRW